MNALKDSLVELIRRASAELPDDVNRALVTALENEKKGTIAASAGSTGQNRLRSGSKQWPPRYSRACSSCCSAPES